MVRKFLKDLQEMRTLQMIPGEAPEQEVEVREEDGAITFVPALTKGEAGYTGSVGDSNQLCGECSHYIKGGGCHVVRGEIDPEATCGFYADIGIFANQVVDSDEVNVSMILWGLLFNYSEEQREMFLDRLNELMENRVNSEG